MEKPSKVDWKKSYWAEAEKCATLTAELSAMKAERDAALALIRAQPTPASDNIRRMQESLSLGQVKTDNIGD